MLYVFAPEESITLLLILHLLDKLTWVRGSSATRSLLTRALTGSGRQSSVDMTHALQILGDTCLEKRFHTSRMIMNTFNYLLITGY